jgi:hypothetical protein
MAFITAEENTRNSSEYSVTCPEFESISTKLLCVSVNAVTDAGLLLDQRQTQLSYIIGFSAANPVYRRGLIPYSRHVGVYTAARRWKCARRKQSRHKLSQGAANSSRCVTLR